MRYLYKIFHEKNTSDFEKIYNERFNFDSSIHLDMHIKPLDQPKFYELYYIPSNKMIDLIANIYMISKKFNETFIELPPIAQKQFINECLIEELYNTNQLEGIKSSREEIAKSAKEVISNKKTNRRFESMIRSYLRLVNSDFHFPTTAKEIRQIYDDITEGEMDQQELPDGEVFRNEITYVLKKSGSGKVVHQGVTPESKIIELTEKLLKFMNNNTVVPNIIKVAVGHYYFGYIHPFYDGNGRTSRFISSMYLSKDLGNVPTLSLSRGCNKFKNKYLEAFENTNSIRSKGELNSFIETFLEIMMNSLEQMTAELKEKSHLLNIAREKLKSESKLKKLPEIYAETLFVLAQNHFFDSNSGLTVRDLSSILLKSEATIRKVMNQLLRSSFVRQRGERPAFYGINQKYFED